MSDLEVYLDFIRTERLEIVEDLEQIYIQLQSFISRNNSTRNQDYLANLFDLISKYIEAEKKHGQFDASLRQKRGRNRKNDS